MCMSVPRYRRKLRILAADHRSGRRTNQSATARVACPSALVGKGLRCMVNQDGTGLGYDELFRSPIMSRSQSPKLLAMRQRIAACAARVMAEDGIDDFALAKRKA